MGMFGTKTAVSALCLTVFGFIGAGKAGFTLGKYFAESGKDI